MVTLKICFVVLQMFENGYSRFVVHRCKEIDIKSPTESIPVLH